MDVINWMSNEFTVCNYSDNWNNVSGIYIFAGLNHQGLWHPFYVGQCDSFRNRIPSHERWEEAVQLGATHIHAMAVQSAADRNSIEAALIRAYQPELNDQLR